MESKAPRSTNIKKDIYMVTVNEGSRIIAVVSNLRDEFCGKFAAMGVKQFRSLNMKIFT